MVDAQSLIRNLYYTAIDYWDKFQYSERGLKASCFGTRYGRSCVATELLNQASTVWSVGVGNDISFDRKLIDLVGCRVHAFDPTPESVQWVSGQDIPPEFIFHEWGIAAATGQQRLYLPDNKDHVSGSLKADGRSRSVVVEFRSLSDTAALLGHDIVDYLKLDVEGAEVDILRTYLSDKSHPFISQWWVEFHPTHLGGDRPMKEIIEKMEDVDYQVVRKSGLGYLFVHESAIG